VKRGIMTDLLTTGQVQTLLKVDRTTIYRMVESGRLPGIRVGKQWRFDRAEIERWLAAAPAGPATGITPTTAATARVAPAGAGAATLRDAMPLACVQLVQDMVAEMLGVMMVVTDMDARPVTRVSNPSGLFTTLMRGPEALQACMPVWRELALSPSLAPTFVPNEMGLLCARGLIRMGGELAGMVVIGGIAPKSWPPTDAQVSAMSRMFEVPESDIRAQLGDVYHLDRSAQEKALHFVQRVADIFAHMTNDRNTLCGKLQAIASLTTL
jgi:excisionase family DNA binding protein